jgi:hypothetical protein
MITNQWFSFSWVLVLLLSGLGQMKAQVGLDRIGLLPDQIQESSGLVWIEDRLFTHNDSGGNSQVYEIDPKTGQLLRTITVSGASAVDWEDLAQDENYLYIGDFGNNLGSRTDLRVYRLVKSDLLAQETISAEQISFSLEDQENIEPRETHPYDMEALIALGDALVIFTKDWENFGTRAYRLPKDPGNHVAINIGESDIQGLVTAAAFRPQTGQLYLLGYSSILRPFLVQAEGVSLQEIFGSRLEKQPLEIGFAQAEGLALGRTDSLFVTTESFNSNPLVNSPAALYAGRADLFDSDEEDPDIPGEPGETESNSLTLYRPSGSNDLHFQLLTDQAVLGRAIYSSNGRRVQYTPPEELTDEPIPISQLTPGVFFS